ncbi:MAG: SMC-Scp complex subunit ScpB [Planctomycetia bacterium]|nr:SMC-Scp complex subunit ScpB [Planctomycetia bacterium]
MSLWQWKRFASEKWHAKIGRFPGNFAKPGKKRSSEKLAKHFADKETGEALARTKEMLRLETILFLSREPMSLRKLASFATLESTEKTLQCIRNLNQLYDQHHYAFRILEFAGGFQLRARPQFTPWLRRLCSQGGVENLELPEIRLSAPAMETLAIIAYRQPIIRAEIESIRGVQCGEILRQLLGKDLIRIAGRSTELGRPRLYKTTRKFLEVFGLKSLSQLPRLEDN